MSTELKTEHLAGTPDLKAWLIEHAAKKSYQWLLAHALDGVIWGTFENGNLTTSHETDSSLPALKWDTLLQCRIFGETAETMLWCNDDGWHATTITDPAHADGYLDEDQMLWGDKGEAAGDGFTRLSDGAQGLRHVVPLEFATLEFGKDPVHRPVRLKVRHILGFDEQTGGAYIKASRLVKLYSVSKKGAQS